MKNFKTSFLFFYLQILSCYVSYNYGQSVLDSSNYYYQSVLNPKPDSDLASAYSYYEGQINNKLLQEDTISAIQNLRMLAITQLELGFLFESESSSIRTIILLDELKKTKTNNEVKNGVYTHLGRVYRRLNNYTKSLEYYNLAIKFAQNNDDSLNIINNMGIIHLEQFKYKFALNKFRLVYEKRVQLDDNNNKLARALDNLGFVQTKIGDPNGLSNMLKALKTRLDQDDKKGVFSSYRHLTYYYLDQEDKRNALVYANKCYDVAKSLNSISYLQEALSLYLDLNEDSRVLEYKKLSDSITKAKQLRDNKFASMKYDRDNEVKKTEATKLQREKEKRLKYLYQSIAAFILLISASSYFIVRTKNKKEKIEQVLKTESRISKMIHDEVANEIYRVMMKLQGKSNDLEEILDNVEEIYNKTRDISKDHASLDVHYGFDVMLKDLLVSYQNNEVTIITRNISKINWEKVSDIKKITIYRVLQELMTNMKKHSKANNVAISFGKKNQKIIIEYKDNGVGSMLKKQMGLKNMESRIVSIGGNIIFDTELNKGFKTTMTI